MWYNAIKVGIHEIDMDHGNIVTMLSMIISRKIEQDLVGKLIDALLNHFQSEEKIIRKLGRDFPEKHRREHQRLQEMLLTKKRIWDAGELDALELAQEIKQILFCHISEFDKFLNAE